MKFAYHMSVHFSSVQVKYKTEVNRICISTTTIWKHTVLTHCLSEHMFHVCVDIVRNDIVLQTSSLWPSKAIGKIFKRHRSRFN